MKSSRRIKRMSKKRLKLLTKMNLTSLMDVFTILVFFLLVNSGAAEVLESPKDVELPESSVEAKPRETVVVFVTPEDVIVQGKAVARVDDILAAPDTPVTAIGDRLRTVQDSIIGPKTRSVASSQEITILADRRVPFAVIKQVMSTCTGEGYGRVSLAVMQKDAQLAQL